MSNTDEAPDKLQALRAHVAAAKNPAERAKATLQLADAIWLDAPSEAELLLEQVAHGVEAACEPKSVARAASMLSELRRRAGDRDASARYADMVLGVADSTGDLRIRAGGLNLVGMIHQERGELQRALQCFEESLQLSRQTGFGEGEQSALNQLAGVHALQGETERALACYRQCLEVSVRTGDMHGRAIDLYNIGWTLESMGRWAEATERFHRTIALCEEHRFRDLLLAARMALGELSLKRSDYDSAALRFSAVIEAEREARHSGQLLREAISNLGWTHFRAGDLARAEETLSEAAQLSETAEDRCLMATIGRRRAELALAQGRLDAARDLLAQAARHASVPNLPKEQGEVLRVEALLSVARAEPGPALELLTRAEVTLMPLGDTLELALTRLQRGRLFLELGRSEEALPMLKSAVRTFRRLSVVAEAEEASRLLYQLEMGTDRDTALITGLFGISALGLAPKRFTEKVLSMLCDNLRFEQGAVLVHGRPVALRGNPDLAELPGRRSSLKQTDLVLFLPVRQDRRLLGHVWLRREQRLATRVKPGLLELVARMLAPSLLKLGELQILETGPAPLIPGLRFQGIVGRNHEVLETLAIIPRVAGKAVPVLIRGESGTGKELVARALHESGPRADRPFVTVNCAAVPESMLEAEFFGVEAGAATGVAARPGKFELAHGGTIFLDEIGDMSPGLQAKLLRVIEDKAVTPVGGTKAARVDVRVIAATNMDLDLRERQGLFRRDLLYRLNTVQLLLPPLCQRREDIPALTSYFVTRTAQEYNCSECQASEGVLTLFAEYPWPGNIRQLQHAVERAVILAAGDTLEITDLPLELRQAGPVSAAQPVTATRAERLKAKVGAERVMLLDALSRANGQAPEAAKLVGFSRTHFYRLLQKHHIKPQK
jgi:DNA-binding NtrC family response regulator/tetratricopeptide (TPR) repeat protein